MSRAEDYILENMKSGLITGWDDKNRPICQSWLTPDQARKAVEIEREEVIKKSVKWLKDNIGDFFSDKNKFIREYKQAMKDE